MTVGIRTEAMGDALFDDGALAALPAWLARATGARSAMILWRHLDGVHEVIAFNHYSPAFAALYAWKYAALDPWVRAARESSRRGEFLPMGERVPAAAFERSRFHREFVRRQRENTGHAAVAVFDAACGEAILCLHRPRRETPFTRSDFDLSDRLLADLGRLLHAQGERIARRRREQVARDDLDRLGLGAIVVGAVGRISRVNLTADNVLRRGDGLRARSGILSCADPTSRVRLQAALALATAPDNPISLAIPVERMFPSPGAAEKGDRPLAYVVSVTPLRARGSPPMALLVFRDPDAPRESLVDRLRALVLPDRAGARALADMSKGRVSAAPVLGRLALRH